MAAFEDFMNAFHFNPETFNEEQFKAAATSAYQQDVSGHADALAAKDTELSARDERIKKLGDENWNLLMKSGPPINDVQDQQHQQHQHDGDGGEPKPKAISEMFKKVDRIR